jgi:hypothetical protein
MVNLTSNIYKIAQNYVNKIYEAKTIKECEEIVAKFGDTLIKLYFNEDMPNRFFLDGRYGKYKDFFGNENMNIEYWKSARAEIKKFNIWEGLVPESLYGGSGNTSIPTNIDAFPNIDDDYFKEITHNGMKFRLFGDGDIKFQKNGQWYVLPRHYAERGRLYGQDASDDPYIESDGKAILGIPYTPGVNGGIEDLWFEVLHRLIQEMRPPEEEKLPEPPQSQDNSVTINQNVYNNPHRSLNGDLIPISVRA